MLATNVFNNLLGMELDDYLEPYVAPARKRTAKAAEA